MTVSQYISHIPQETFHWLTWKNTSFLPTIRLQSDLFPLIRQNHRENRLQNSPSFLFLLLLFCIFSKILHNYLFPIRRHS